MVKFYPSISEDLQEWILTQSMFFTASAPLTGKHVNISPKGYLQSTFAILSPNQVAYLDATGSGAETISHIYENGRVTVMFNSFGASPRIMRLFCTGRVIERADKTFEQWCRKMINAGMQLDETALDTSMSEDDTGPRSQKMGLSGVRAVIVLDVWKVQTSCGFGVPVFPPSGKEGKVEESMLTTTFRNDATGRPWNERPTMAMWAGKMAAKAGALADWQVEYNAYSLDGCPGLKSARSNRALWLELGGAQAKLKKFAVEQWYGLVSAVILGSCLFIVALYVGLIQVNTARLSQFSLA